MPHCTLGSPSHMLGLCQHLCSNLCTAGIARGDVAALPDQSCASWAVSWHKDPPGGCVPVLQAHLHLHGVPSSVGRKWQA
jgi:hypothetical protein